MPSREEVVVELECVGDSSVIHERGEWDDCRECFPPVDTAERSMIYKSIVRMCDPCPACGDVVLGGQRVARLRPADPWSHEDCFDRTATEGQG